MVSEPWTQVFICFKWFEFKAYCTVHSGWILYNIVSMYSLLESGPDTTFKRQHPYHMLSCLSAHNSHWSIDSFLSSIIGRDYLCPVHYHFEGSYKTMIVFHVRRTKQNKIFCYILFILLIWFHHFSRIKMYHLLTLQVR